MKKQYTFYRKSSFKYIVKLYNDGVLIDTTEKWEGDEIDNYLEDIEDCGYTLGFLPEDVEAERKTFETMKNNQIEAKSNGQTI